MHLRSQNFEAMRDKTMLPFQQPLLSPASLGGDSRGSKRSQGASTALGLVARSAKPWRPGQRGTGGAPRVVGTASRKPAQPVSPAGGRGEASPTLGGFPSAATPQRRNSPGAQSGAAGNPARTAVLRAGSGRRRPGNRGPGRSEVGPQGRREL